MVRVYECGFEEDQSFFPEPIPYSSSYLSCVQGESPRPALRPPGRSSRSFLTSSAVMCTDSHSNFFLFCGSSLMINHRERCITTIECYGS